MKENQKLNINSMCFLKELYVIMDEFNMHRIYRIDLNDGEITEAHQILDTNIGRTELTRKIFEFIDKHLPMIYFRIFYNIYLKRYKRKLKKLFNKYGIIRITAVSFSLFQGIYITNNELCINGVEITTKTKDIYHIDNLYLDI